jgi:hypothetical protein
MGLIWDDIDPINLKRISIKFKQKHSPPQAHHHIRRAKPFLLHEPLQGRVFDVIGR